MFPSKVGEGWECSSAIECLPSIYQALGSIPSTGKNLQPNKVGDFSLDAFTSYLSTVRINSSSLLVYTYLHYQLNNTVTFGTEKVAGL